MTPVENKRATLRRDLLIAVGIVLVAAVLGLWQLAQGQRGGYAVVHDGEGGQTVLELSQDGTHAITTSLGTNVVVVQDGSVRVSEADCPNHDCVQQGAISSSSQQLVCLPHKLWVEVVDDPAAASSTQAEGMAEQLDVSSR